MEFLYLAFSSSRAIFTSEYNTSGINSGLHKNNYQIIVIL